MIPQGRNRGRAAVLLLVTLVATSTATAQPSPSPEPLVPNEPSVSTASQGAQRGDTLEARHTPPLVANDSLSGERRPAWLRSLRFTPILDVIAHYEARGRKDDTGAADWYHEFDVPRAQVGANAALHASHLNVLLETVRSTSGGSLIGVAGESIVIRVRNAFIGYALFDRLELRGGVIPTLTIASLERAWGLRVLGPTGLEASGLGSPADLGASALATLPASFGWVGVAAVNGEGYTGRELNRGKTAEVAAVVRPLAAVSSRAMALALHASYVAGSNGTGLARADRITGGITYATDAVGCGFATTYAIGVGDDGKKPSLLIDGFLRVEPWSKLVLGAHAVTRHRDLRVAGDRTTELTMAAGWRPTPPLEALLAFELPFVADGARATSPAPDSWRIRAVARFHLE